MTVTQLVFRTTNLATAVHFLFPTSSQQFEHDLSVTLRELFGVLGKSVLEELTLGLSLETPNL